MKCENCKINENLPFTCHKCKKILCRKCIKLNSHQCDNLEFKLINFCNYNNCLNCKNLIKCNICNNYYCIDHKNHGCRNYLCNLM